MSEEQITNTQPVVETQTVETSSAPTAVEENTQVIQPEVQSDVPSTTNVQEAPTPASAEIKDGENKPVDTPNAEEDIASLKKQLEEYKLREDEVKQLSSRLGTDKVNDFQLLEAQKQLDIIDNQAQQAYINLCNQFGVDYRPDKIEASANELKAKDPQAYYDLNYKLGQLDNVVTQQRNEVNNFVRNREITLALGKYNNILQASPMLQQQLNTYLQTVNPTHPANDIDMFMNMAQAIQAEAFEYGKLFAQQQSKQAPNPADNLNTTVMANQQTFTGEAPRIWTRQEIANMSQKEYEKYADEIDIAVREGRIK